MDDGVGIATTLYMPDGTPPRGGWPAVVMLMHGLGGTREDMNPIAETYLATDGYAVLTFDARGHGRRAASSRSTGRARSRTCGTCSTGSTRTGTSRRDARRRARASRYGGGAVWRAAVEGVPFAAIEPVDRPGPTSTARSIPQNLSKGGAIAALLAPVPPSRTAPELARLRSPTCSRARTCPSIRTLTDQRSSVDGARPA